MQNLTIINNDPLKWFGAYVLSQRGTTQLILPKYLNSHTFQLLIKSQTSSIRS